MSAIRIALVLLGSSIGLASLSAQPVSLAFKPLDVQYSKSLDRLVMISANPNQVHLVNAVSGAETTINLSLAPLSLSVSPDGTHAAVGHDGWISYVNLSSGYVEKNLAISATANLLLLAGNGNIWVPPANATLNVATGVQTASASSPYGLTNAALHPNGYWIYNTSGGSPNVLSKGDMSSGVYQYLYTYPYWGDFPSCGGIFYSADGNRLLTGCGTLFRTTASKTDDMTYNGALSAAPLVTSASDSLISQKFAVIPGTAYYNSTTTDTEIQFYDDQYLTLLGRLALPVYTSGSVSAPWHGRFLFYSPDSTKLYVVLQADATAKLTNDYAIYPLTLSTGSGCLPSLSLNGADLPANGGSANVTVTATTGCLWQASSNVTWLSVQAGGISSGSGTVTIQASPNLQTNSRTGTVTIAGLTYTVIQDAASAPGSNPVTTSPVRPVAADYSLALDRMILVSANPNLLTILDPVTGNSQAVQLVMPPTALSISTDGLHAAVGHDGLISYVNLANATVGKTMLVDETVFALALGPTAIYAFPLRDQWEAIRVVDIAGGTETLWNWVYAGSAAGKISPNGKYLYINATKRYDVTQPLPSAFDAIDGITLQWFSQDGSRLFSGSGQAFRLSDIASQDLQYNGTIESGGLSAVADSSVQQVTAVVPTGSTNDTSIAFFAQQYLAAVGSIAIPKFTSGSNSYNAHGRYLFWNKAGNRVFAVIQADATSGFLNDYAIYTVSLNGGCGISLATSSSNVAAAGGNFTLGVTANPGCAWKASSNASWLTISANALSAGPATISYIVDPNLAISPRSATITVDGVTFTVTQAAGSQVQLSAVNGLPFRVADAEYSSALDRIVAISSNPNRLNIYDPTTGINTPVTLPLPGNAVSVAPSGLLAAVCHDGLVSIVNLQTATIQNSVNVSVDCYDIVLAGNGYLYMSVNGGWGTSDSVNIATGAETTAALLYNGTNFRLNATGDAIYTSGTGTSAESVSRYSIAGGPMVQAYQSDWYPAHPVGNKLWFTHDGRMAGDTGGVFNTGSTLATDFIYTGTLSGFGTIGSVVSLAHSTTRHLFASIGPDSSGTGGSDVNLFLHGDKYLALSSKMTLPKITQAGVSATSHGKFVFWDSTGTTAYLILQADPSAGFQNDFAVYTLSPAFTPGCAVTLGTNSGTAIAYADTGSVAVNAASGCVWQVTSNVSWISIDSGTLGVGIGNLSYSVLANPNTMSRTGILTIGTQTFTITQAGLSQPPGTWSLSLPPNSAVGVAIAPTLTWSPAANAASYDVYLGTSAQPSLVANVSGTTYIPATLSPGVKYYWQVVAKNAAGSTPSTVWSFTTQANRTAQAALRNSAGSILLSAYASKTLANSGGLFASDPSAAQDVSGNTFVTARDNYQSIWTNIYNAATATWAGWRFGGGIIQGVPSIVVDAAGTGWIASRDTYNSYWLASYSTTGGLGTWTALYGIFSTDPVVTACGDGSIYLIGKDNYNSLWSGRYIPGTGFQGWVFGGGIVRGAPAATCGSDNAVYVVAEDNFSSNWMARVAGNTWTGWYYGGAITSVTPRIASLGNGTEAVLILDSTGVVWRTTFTEGTGNGWQPWTQVGGVLQDVAAAAVNGQLYFAGKAPNGDLWWWLQTGNQWTWIGNTGVAAGSLSATPR